MGRIRAFMVRKIKYKHPEEMIKEAWNEIPIYLKVNMDRLSYQKGYLEGFEEGVRNSLEKLE
jgi:predicted molibdopterin-dependent oxidoreductase YjgC